MSDMFRFCLLGLVGIVVFGSSFGKVASQSPDSVRSSKLSKNATSMHQMAQNDFVPDSLASEDDDAEEETAEKLTQGNIETVREVKLSTDKPNLFRPSHSQKGIVETTVNGHTRSLKASKQALDVKTKTTTATSNDTVAHAENPRGKVRPHSSWPFMSSSLAFTNADNRVAAGDKNRQTSPTNEEEKVRLTTRKLVKWLRNRLRKRLEEVAGLEEKCNVENKLLAHLKETIEAEASERQAEIKVKLQTQNELKDMHRHFMEPNRELQEFRAENSRLVDQLNRLKKMYNDLAVTRKEMEDRLVSAGFTHWLDKRGKEYMPATAVGVLSKSARILDPVSRGFEEIVKLDELFSSGVESVIPIPRRSLISKITRDLALLMPVIPVIMLIWRINHVSRRLSILHLVMYISTIFAIESGLIFGLSLCIGTEVIKELQSSYELFVVTGVFVNVLLFIVMMAVQLLVTTLRRTKSEVTQSLLSLAIGYHFFRNVFQPVAVSQAVTTTTAAHSLYGINFTLIALEKKAILKVGTRFDKHLNSLLLGMERWVCETWQGMKDLFVDSMPVMSEDDDTMIVEADSVCSDNERLREVEAVVGEHTCEREKADVEQVAKALNASREYARWSAAGTSQRRTGQGRRTFRGGMRWYETNEQESFEGNGSNTVRRLTGQKRNTVFP